MENVVEILKALSDSSRYTIVSLLVHRDFCVGALAQRVGISEAAVSQHLQVLRAAGLVRGEKRGYFTHYEVNRDVLRKLADELIDLSSCVRVGDCGCHTQNRESHCCACRKEEEKHE